MPAKDNPLQSGARIYLASSWTNPEFQKTRDVLRRAGHEVYDFKDPENYFRWSQIDPNYRYWNLAEFRGNLDHPEMVRGFERDMTALQVWSNMLVMVMPCGRSAHLELGYAAARLLEGCPDQSLHEMPCAVFFPSPEAWDGPDLMWKVADIVVGFDELITWTAAQVRYLKIRGILPK